MARVVIRRVDVSDALVREQLHLLHSEAFAPDDWADNQIPKPTTGYWWIATVDGEPAGFAGLRPSVRWDSTGYLCSAGVLPAYRGQGIQKLLVQKRVRAARELGWHTAITDTICDNVPSMRSLIACGFRPYVPAVKWANEFSVYWKRATTREAA